MQCPLSAPKAKKRNVHSSARKREKWQGRNGPTEGRNEIPFAFLGSSDRADQVENRSKRVFLGHFFKVPGAKKRNVHSSARKGEKW